MQSNLSRSKPPAPLRADPGAHSNPESARQVSEGEDFTHSRQLIESLMEDNRLLQEEIDDYRRVASILHTRCLDLQKELELEKLKHSEIDAVKLQLQTANEKTQAALKQNVALKDKCLSLVEFLRQTAFDVSQEEKEDQVLVQKLSRENGFLRELLQLSRISEPKIAEIEALLKDEEAGLNMHPGPEYTQLLESYRQQRFARKSKSIGLPGTKKGYLLETHSSAKPDSGWDSFFARPPKPKSKS